MWGAVLNAQQRQASAPLVPVYSRRSAAISCSKATYCQHRAERHIRLHWDGDCDTNEEATVYLQAISQQSCTICQTTIVICDVFDCNVGS